MSTKIAMSIKSALHIARSFTDNFAAAAIVLGLALVITATASASVQAADATPVAIETRTSSAEEVAHLRQLLSQPHLTVDDQRLLDRTLEDVSEEMADASEQVEQPKSFVETVNDLLGVKRTKATAQG